MASQYPGSNHFTYCLVHGALASLVFTLGQSQMRLDPGHGLSLKSGSRQF